MAESPNDEKPKAEVPYRAILSASIDGFLILDESGRFLDANDAYCRMIGYSREELLNMSVRDVDATESPEETRARIEYIMRTGTGRFEVKHRTKDDRIIDVEVSVNYVPPNPMEPHQEGGGRLYAFYRDITDRKKLENELNELNRLLEKRVAEEVEKNRWKDHVMFEQSRLAAMGELILNISHHWRQPLAAISSHVQDLGDAWKFNELTQDYLDKSIKTIMDEVHGLSGTIDSFRIFYNKETESQRFSVAGAVRQSMSLLESWFSERNIFIETDMDEDVTVEGYPNEFSRVVMIILDNVKDVFESRNIDGGHLKIELSGNGPGGKAVLSISDDGGGASDEVMERLFDPYFTTKHKFRGTGLSLFIAKAIIEQNMGGSIKVEVLEDPTRKRSDKCPGKSTDKRFFSQAGERRGLKFIIEI